MRRAICLAMLVLLGMTSAALATPDLQLFRNGNVAENTSDDIGASVAGTQRSVIYMIVNGGNTTLSLPAAAVTAATTTNATCSVAVQPNVVVIAGSSTLFTVQVTPTAGGVFSCGWSIASDDPDQPFTFVMAGAASGPAGLAVLEVVNAEGRALANGDFDRFDTVVGLERRRPYVIANTGTALMTLAVSIQDGPNATCRIFNAPPAELAPGTIDGLLVVSVAPLSAGPATCTLELMTNDQLAAPARIELTNQPGLELAYLGMRVPSGGEIVLLATDDRRVPFTLENLDSAPINRIEVEIIGTCTVSVAPPSELAAGGTAPLAIRAPDEDFECILAIRSNDFFLQSIVIRGSGAADPCGGDCNAAGEGGLLVMLVGLVALRRRRRTVWTGH